MAGWVFWVLTAGIGEESGWRGYALPKLQNNMSALSATLIVTLLGGLAPTSILLL
ncbi:MAG: CPBP family intramembrane metalloprotease [Actinobacteria bacterium]|nr:CPBP family intramembrane metalloprotease [Actinomycetota bacterium]